MINGDVIKWRGSGRGTAGGFQVAPRLDHQALASAAGTSAIEPPAAPEDRVFEAGLEFLDAFNFLSRFHQNVFGHSQPPQTTMRPLRTANGRFVAPGHHDKKINVAVLARASPCVRAEKPDFIGAKFRHEPLRRRPKQTVVERFHYFFLAQDTSN